ncbi:hypothetical protein WHY20_04280 [Clostridium perfringens]|uniref:AbiU2 domain-containing protein n=1 Tax=Clostridium perfringens TaxID=1502 RepID=UPI0030CD6790
MNNKELMKLELLNELNEYKKQLMYLKDLNEVYKHMMCLNDERKAIAPNFFLIIEGALIDSYMMSLGRLYDKSKQTKTIIKLINRFSSGAALFNNKKELLDNLNHFKENIEKDEEISETIKIIQERRDLFFAHNDKKFFGEKINDYEAYLPNYKVWELISFTESILKYLYKQFSIDENFNCKYDRDFEKLIIHNLNK